MLRSTVNDLLAGSVGMVHSHCFRSYFSVVLGGAAQVLVGQPLDTIKTRAQIAPSASLCLNISYSSHKNRGHVCRPPMSLPVNFTVMYLPRTARWISSSRLSEKKDSLLCIKVVWQLNLCLCSRNLRHGKSSYRNSRSQCKASYHRYTLMTSRSRYFSRATQRLEG